MVELADTHDLGSCAERRAGSSPARGTMRVYIIDDKLAYIHVSKHGGTTVYHTLKPLGKFQDIIMRPKEIIDLKLNGHFVASAMRNPLDWYKSVHAWGVLNPESKITKRNWEEKAWDDDLNKWVENVTNTGRAAQSIIYAKLKELCDCLIKTESLSKELPELLEKLGYGKVEMSLPQRVVGSDPEIYPQKLSDQSKESILRLEVEALKWWQLLT